MLAQHYIVQRFIEGKSTNPAACWEATKWGYVYGTTATETVTTLRNDTARYIRASRTQCQDHGVRAPRYRLISKPPFKLNSN